MIADTSPAPPIVLADRPLLGRVALPWLLAAYIVYILLWYLPFKFLPDSYLFQVLGTSSACPGSSRISTISPAGSRRWPACCW